MKEKVLITGGAGFIGSHLSNTLYEMGFDVAVLDNFSAGKRSNLHKKIKIYKSDITEFQKIKKYFKGVKFVFHLAAIPSVQYSIENPSKTNEVNLGGTINVLMAAGFAKVKRVIFSSSSSVYGDSDKLPIKETNEKNPKSPYAMQKLFSEYYCRYFSNECDLETVCLRYFNVYGKGQNKEGAYASVIPKFLDLHKKNKPLTITGDGKQTRDFINIKDVVLANIAAMKNEKIGDGECFNIGSGKEVSVLEIANLIGGEKEYLPARKEPRNSLADISLAKEKLKWTPTISLAEGLRELL